ncbi:MAG: superoxide dismutase family protein [Thermoanaerobaculia bacterium]
MQNRLQKMLFLLPAVLFFGGIAVAGAASAATATATLSGVAGSPLSGTVSFTETSEGVDIVVAVEHAPPGVHGFHLHEKGDCSAADFTSTGGHFNPTGAAHGAPDAAAHHAGDYGNLTVGEDGKGELKLHSTMLTVVDGPNSVRGRGVILHEKADDLTTQPTGAAGGRIACGVVK